VRQVVATLFASVDGYASDSPDERMGWVTDEFGEEMSAFGLAQLRAADTLLLGRVTYEAFARYWPSAGEDEGEFAPLMNDMEKLVVSRTLRYDDITWQNTRVARGDLIEEVTALKRAPGRDIAVSGSIELVGSLMALGLLDRLQLEVHPIVLGPAGGRAIFDGYDMTRLRLVDTTVLDNRVVVIDYQPLPDHG
jgi:dihydrofolate reductase